MSTFHVIWIVPCDAAQGIRERYGTEKALGYLVGEKLLNFVRASEIDPDFASELPAFVARVREEFEPHELRAYLDEVRRVGAVGHTMNTTQYESAREAGMFGEEDVVRGAEDVLRVGVPSSNPAVGVLSRNPAVANLRSPGRLRAARGRESRPPTGRASGRNRAGAHRRQYLPPACTSRRSYAARR